MEMDIFGVLEKYGLKGVGVLVLFFAIKYMVGSDWFGKWWDKRIDKVVSYFFKRNDNRTITESDILNHDLFNYIDFWINSKIPTFQFSTEYRTIIFKRYLSIFLKSYKEEFSRFVNDRSYQTMDQSELWKALLDLINHIIFSYEKESIESGIPKIVVIKMKGKNNDTISLTIDLIESVSNSQFYESDKNFLKMYSILNIILSVLESTISNSESICDSINGQLKGLVANENGKTYKES